MLFLCDRKSSTQPETEAIYTDNAQKDAYGSATTVLICQ